MPQLESTIAAAVERGFNRFLDDELATLEAVALVHCDLGCEHILIGDDGSTVTGLIDFEDVTVGDPAIDFVGIYVTHGMETVKRILDRYQHGTGGHRALDVQRSLDAQRSSGVQRSMDDNFEKRLRFYTWMASCHGIIYGLEDGKDDLVEEGISGLQIRLGHAGLL